MSREWTSIISKVFTFFRFILFKSWRTMATNSFNCLVSLASKVFMACLSPSLTARNASSTSQVHQTREPAFVILTTAPRALVGLSTASEVCVGSVDGVRDVSRRRGRSTRPERPQNPKRDHPLPSFLETTRVDGVKAPQRLKTRRYAPIFPYLRRSCTTACKNASVNKHARKASCGHASSTL